MSAIVKTLKIYPLKSAQGIEVSEMPIDGYGPVYDREWMLIDDKNRFITQRTERRLVMIKPSLKNGFLELKVDPLFFTNPHFPQPLFKSYPDLKIPLEHSDQPKIEVKIFDQPTNAHHLSTVFDQWFSDLFGKKMKLVRSLKTPERTTSGRHGPQAPLRFPDGYPFLLINQATIDELGEKWGDEVSADRFRANIVIENCPASHEESWKDFSIDGVEFESVKKCTRCVIIDLDPQLGHKEKSITPALKTYRLQNNQIIFGINLTHKNNGVIKKSSTLDF